MKFLYRVDSPTILPFPKDEHRSILEQWLNNYGNAGWELINIQADNYIFKKAF